MANRGSTATTGLRDVVNVCQLCGALENLSLCGGCRGTWYCCKDHQRQDWKDHKRACKKVKKAPPTDSDASSSASESVRAVSRSAMPNEATEDSVSDTVDNIDPDSPSAKSLSEELTITSLTPRKGDRSSNIESLEKKDTNIDNSSDNSAHSYALPHPTPAAERDTATSSIHNYPGIGERDSGQVRGVNVPRLPAATEKEKREAESSKKRFKCQQAESLSVISEDGPPPERYYLSPSTHRITLPPLAKSAVHRQSQASAMGMEDYNLSPAQSREQYLSVLRSRFDQLAKYAVQCLTRFGLCVIDKFLGDITGMEILKEVQQLETAGIMKQGQLVHGPSASSNKYIRGDMITWVDGTEPRSENIHFLISCMDAVILQCASQLDAYTINERTKAMVACYPGRKTRYVRHVDNPNGDGRCITCIYYLNKDWDVRKDGGLLRIFPEGEDRVANVEPIFDRLILFWSDRRNPHEVEEAYKERFAITVWYYDAEERAEALKKFKGSHKSGSMKSQAVSLLNGNLT